MQTFTSTASLLLFARLVCVALLACVGTDLAAVDSDYDPYYDHAWSDLDYDSYRYGPYGTVRSEDAWSWEADPGPAGEDYYQEMDSRWQDDYQFRRVTWGWNWEQEPSQVGIVDDRDDYYDDADDYYEDFDPDDDFDTEWDADLDADEDPIEATRDYDDDVDVNEG